MLRHSGDMAVRSGAADPAPFPPSLFFAARPAPSLLLDNHEPSDHQLAPEPVDKRCSQRVLAHILVRSAQLTCRARLLLARASRSFHETGEMCARTSQRSTKSRTAGTMPIR